MTASRTARGLIREATLALERAGVETPALDARLLLLHVLDIEREQLLADPDMAVTVECAGRFETLTARRASREPLSHLTGRREFWSLDFAVTRDTLDPRPDSESLITAVLERLDEAGHPRSLPYRLLDLGTGTGCLLLALLQELPKAEGLGVDISEAAIAVAKRNAEALGLGARARFARGDWGSGAKSGFDIAISNPPYIRDADIDRLAPEVKRYEPRLALSGGEDGLDPYRAIVPDLARLLAGGENRIGLAAFETGATQAHDVASMLERTGAQDIRTHRDLARRERAVSGCFPGKLRQGGN